MKVEVQGLDELVSLLGALSDSDTVLRAAKDGLMRVGKAIQVTAQELCCVDTSELHDNIETTELVGGVDVGTNVKQGFYEEYGTGRQGDPSVTHTDKEMWSYMDDDGKWHTTRGHEPHPFLYPALKAHESEISPFVKEALQEEIDRHRR